VKLALYSEGVRAKRVTDLNQVEPETIKMYLLGQLDQAKLAQLEERLLTDATFFDELSIAEDELTDQYLAGELSDEERRDFETHFLSAPERRQKLRFARSLKRYVSQAIGTSAQEDHEPSISYAGDTAEPRSKKRPFFSFLPQKPAIAYSLAAAVILAIIGISWVVFNNLRPTPRGTGNVLVVTLTPGLVRETGEIKSIHIPPGTDSVRLQLGLIADEYQSYRAELITSERAGVLVEENLRPELAAGNKIINLTIPVDLLKHDDYRVRLSGRHTDGSYEDIGSYVFRVVE
jgi:hypothetical protein